MGFRKRWNMEQSSVNFVLKHWRSGSCREDVNEFYIKPADWSFSLPKGEEGPVSVRSWVSVCVCEGEREMEQVQLHSLKSSQDFCENQE